MRLQGVFVSYKIHKLIANPCKYTYDNKSPVGSMPDSNNEKCEENANDGGIITPFSVLNNKRRKDKIVAP